MMQVVTPKKELTVVGDFICYDILPNYVKSGDLFVSEDKDYIYDVEGVMTCNSRREFVSLLAKAKGKQIAPLSATGAYIAYPYSTRFHHIGLRRFGTVSVMSSVAMSNAAIVEPRDLIKSEHNAVIFVAGDFDGEKVTPFEQFGSTFPVQTFLSPDRSIRYPAIKQFLGKKGIVFSSFNALLEHASLIAHCCCGDVGSMIITPETVKEPLRLEEDHFDNDMDKGGYLSGDFENKSVRQKMVEWFADCPTPKTIDEIIEHFPSVNSSELLEILLYLPVACPVLHEKTIHWSLTLNQEFSNEISDQGLSHFLDARELKMALVTGELDFTDVIEFDAIRQITFASMCGFQCIEEVEFDDVVKRVFRKGPLRVDF